jgi:hypothetical protein
MSVQVLAPDSADPAGPPPRLRVRTDRALCRVELASDPVLFDPSLVARRPPDSFHSSGDVAVREGRAEYRPDAPAWERLRRHPFLYYRAAAYEAGPSRPELTVADADYRRAPALRVAPPPAGRLRGPRALGATLPRLRVDRDRIVDPAGDVVVLRGAALRALESAAGAVSRAEVRTLARSWRANLVRAAVNQERVLTQPAYVRSLDRVVEWAAAEGAYTLLAVTRLDERREWGRFPSGAPNPTAPLPEENTVRMWGLLAARYSRSPAVLFEVFHEPHRPLANDTSFLLRQPADDAGWHALWHGWIRRIADTVRRESPEAMLVVSGWRWGLDLRSFPVPVAAATLENALYSAHVAGSHPEGLATAGEADWNLWFGFDRLRSQHPVVVGSWGEGGMPLVRANDLERFLRDRHRFVRGAWPGVGGWAHASWADLVDASGAPTELGELVRGALRTMPASASADFDPARPAGTRSRDLIAISEARRRDFFVVHGHDFAPGTRIVFIRGTSDFPVVPGVVLPHMLLVAELPASVPAGAGGVTAVRVERPGGALSEPVAVTVSTTARGAERVLAAGAAIAAPYTLLFLANPVVQRRNGSLVNDPIQSARAAFHRCVVDAIGQLFGTSETLLRPYAGEIRIVTRFATAPRLAANALCVQHRGGLMAPEQARIAAHLAALARVADHCFVVFRSTTHARSTTAWSTEDGGSAGRAYRFDAATHNHRQRSSQPGATALAAPTAGLTALHEYLHGALELDDLYVDHAPTTFVVNRKRRASRGARRPAGFASLDGHVYDTDPRRDSLGYGAFLSYHPELADARRPNVMDDYWRSPDTPQRCRLDLLSLRFMRDRLEWKLSR